jgi:hypothetical protein
MAAIIPAGVAPITTMGAGVGLTDGGTAQAIVRIPELASSPRVRSRQHIFKTTIELKSVPGNRRAEMILAIVIINNSIGTTKRLLQKNRKKSRFGVSHYQ